MNQTSCAICQDPFDLSKQQVQLECLHIFCSDCLQTYIKEKIKSHQISRDSLLCPNEQCKKPLNFYRIKAILTTSDFEQYEQLLIKDILLLQDERFFICPNCNLRMIIPKKEDISFLKCEQCKKCWCTNEDCMGDWDEHKGIVCEEFKKGNFKGKQEQEVFEDLVKEKGWMPCPKCGSMVEKMKNCNYIRCESTKCQKKTLFCYICGELLKESDVTEHYKNENAFSGCKKKKMQKEENEKTNQIKNDDEELKANRPKSRKMDSELVEIKLGDNGINPTNDNKKPMNQMASSNDMNQNHMPPKKPESDPIRNLNTGGEIVEKKPTFIQKWFRCCGCISVDNQGTMGHSKENILYSKQNS